MASIKAISKASAAVCRGAQTASAVHSKRLLHSSATRWAISNMQMPAMSPTMTEGGIASWKKKDGESFVQGDVLLEIETDKATIEVEAQDDGIMGKILVPDGTKGVPIGKVIALLAEEGDDISNLEAPKEEAAPPPKASEQPSSQPPPTERPPIPEIQPAQASEAPSHAPSEHPRTLFPSVQRLLLENNITNPEEIKGTGVRGMLTKGDVLAFLGKASSPLGTFTPAISPIEEANKAAGKKAPEVEAPEPAKVIPQALDGPAIRRLIVTSMLQASLKARNPVPASIKDADFDSILADYLPTPSAPSPKADVPTASTPKN